MRRRRLGRASHAVKSSLATRQPRDATDAPVLETAMGQPIYATPNKPFLTNTYLELYVIIGITIFSSTVLYCIFKDVKRRDAIRRTLSGARLCGMDKVA